MNVSEGSTVALCVCGDVKALERQLVVLFERIPQGFLAV
jgi:hypothetical protein